MRVYVFFLFEVFFLLVVFSCNLKKVEPSENFVSASFSLFNADCKAPCQIYFTNTSTGAVSYEWDFGDGSPIDTQIHPIHTFQMPGEYWVELKVFGERGVDSNIQLVNVQFIMFEKIFGGSKSEEVRSVKQTSDGGYIIAGTTESFGAGDKNVYLIKVNGLGEVMWEKNFGGENSDYGYSVQETSDGGFIIAGNKYSNVSERDVYLIKANNLGEVMWEETFGGGNINRGESVQETFNGGYIIAGNTYSYGSGNSDVYLIKTNGSGGVEWVKTFGGVNDDMGKALQKTSDGGYIIVGYTSSYGFGSSDVYLIKTNSSGGVEWEKTFGGSGAEYGYSVQQTSDGGYIIVGYTSSYGFGGGDVYLIKTNSSGIVEWEKTFGGSGAEYGYSVQQTFDGGFILTGSTSSYGVGQDDIFLIKTNSSGGVEWEKTFGGPHTDRGYSVQQTSDSGYVIVGTQAQNDVAVWADIILLKTDGEGNVE
ncbi:MAG: PKD domain-containing protein [Saprospiraceae bacterium]